MVMVETRERERSLTSSIALSFDQWTRPRVGLARCGVHLRCGTPQNGVAFRCGSRPYSSSGQPPMSTRRAALLTHCLGLRHALLVATQHRACSLPPERSCRIAAVANFWTVFLRRGQKEEVGSAAVCACLRGGRARASALRSDGERAG
eukprot:363544-Chlamydomonas_euryale.AAC.12